MKYFLASLLFVTLVLTQTNCRASFEATDVKLYKLPSMGKKVSLNINLETYYRDVKRDIGSNQKGVYFEPNREKIATLIKNTNLFNEVVFDENSDSDFLLFLNIEYCLPSPSFLYLILSGITFTLIPHKSYIEITLSGNLKNQKTNKSIAFQSIKKEMGIWLGIYYIPFSNSYSPNAVKDAIIEELLLDELNKMKMKI